MKPVSPFKWTALWLSGTQWVKSLHRYGLSIPFVMVWSSGYIGGAITHSSRTCLTRIGRTRRVDLGVGPVCAVCRFAYDPVDASCNGQFRLGRGDHRCRCALAVVRIDSAARSDAGEQLVVRGARDHCAQRLADTGHPARPNRADGLCRRHVWTSPCQCVT